MTDHDAIVNEARAVKHRPIIIAIALWLFFLPLIVSFRLVQIPQSLHNLLPATSVVNLFYAAKIAYFIVGMLFFSFVSRRAMIAHLRTMPWSWTANYIAYSVTIVISLVFSDYIDLAWWGYPEHFEGSFVWLSYLMLALVIGAVVKRRDDLTLIQLALVAPMLPIGILAIFQYLQLDPLSHDWLQRLIFHVAYRDYHNLVHVKQSAVHVYGTIGNANYLAHYAAMTLFLQRYILRQTKRRLITVFVLATSIVTIVTICISGSTMGYLLLLAFVVYNLFLQCKKSWCDVYFSTAISRRLMTIIALVAVVGLATVSYMAVRVRDPLDIRQVVAIDHNTKLLRFILVDQTTLTIQPQPDTSTFMITHDHNSIKPQIKADGWHYDYSCKATTGHLVYQPNDDQFHLTILHPGITEQYRFSYDWASGNFMYNRQLLPIGNQDVPVIRLFGNEFLWSGRAYIWNRCLPLLLHSPFIGYGADHIAVLFPQTDILNKNNIAGNVDTLIVKAHNIILQLALNYGLLFVVCFLWIAIHTIRQLHGFQAMVVVIYLIGGLSNDSVITTSALAFTMIGIAMSKIE